MAKLALTLILIYYLHILMAACMWLSLQSTLMHSLFAFIKKQTHILCVGFGYFFIVFYIFYLKKH